MHHLREQGTVPGDFRPRLLASRGNPALRPVLAAAALCAIAAVIVACTPGASRSAGASAAGLEAGASWFQLQSTVFQPVSAADAPPTVPAAPWTVQTRVTDMAFLGETLYCAVNGAGLAAIDSDAPGKLEFSYHYDVPIFTHRTMTTLIPRHGDLMIHLYYNALLNDVKPEGLLLKGISLVTFLPGQKDFAFVIPPFQKKNPEWEAVGFAPISENEFDFEWKYTDANETRFAYTRYRADLRLEAGSNRDAYVAALGTPSLTGPGVPGSYRAFFTECRARLPGLPAATALHFKVRSRAAPVQKYFRSGLEQDSILVVHVLDENGTLYALLPGGQVLEKSAGTEPRVAALPALPEGFRYTDFVKWGDSLIIAWEETRFTDVGRAGILVFQLRP